VREPRFHTRPPLARAALSQPSCTIPPLRGETSEVLSPLWHPVTGWTVDRYLEGRADLTHPGVGQPAEPVDQNRDRDAFDRVQVDRRPPGDGVLTRFEENLAGEPSNRCRARRDECPSGRGITASRERITTGRRPISAISHHHTSPRAGNTLTKRPRPVATTPDRPTRPARRLGARRRRRNSRPPRRIGDEPAVAERLIDQGGVGNPRPQVPGTVEDSRVHGRAQACPLHAISMPLRIRRWSDLP